MNRKLRVLIVDDSLFMRAAVKKVLESDARLTVCGVAKDGVEGVARAAELAPDVITMDFNMPRMDGAEAVRTILKRRPTPIVMLSAHTTEGAKETIEALAAGAVDFMTKPSGEVSADLGVVGPVLIAKVIAAASARVIAPASPPPRSAPLGGSAISGPTWPPTGPKVVMVAISTGGPAALTHVIPQLPAEMPFGLIVVQHMPAQFTATLAERLNATAAIEVREAKDGDRPRQGLALIAPGDRHLEIEDGGKLRVVEGPEVNGCRPSADVTMKAGARVFGRRAVGVVMTGMGKDGAEGLAAIKAAGGKTFAQDRASCVIWGMPRAAVELGVVDEVLDLDDIAGRLRRI